MSRAARRLLVVGVVSLAACAAGGFFDPAAFFQAWLITWLLLLGLALGSMGQLMIHELTGGTWGRVLRPSLEAATLTLPLVALLALPLAFGLPELFQWARPDVVAHDQALRSRAWYLAPTPFLARNAVLLIVWSAFGVALVRRAHAAPAEPGSPARLLSVTGLIVYLLTVTLAAFDWVSSLVPQFYSTAIGVRLGAAQFLASLAFGVAFTVWRITVARRAPVPARDCQDFGNLLLTYAMFWAYIAFTEYLIIWAEDLPRETAWYWPRATTSWRWLVVAVVALDFAVPVVAMLFRRVKRDAVALSVVCVLALAGQWLDMVWLTAPSLRPQGFSLRPLDVLALVGMGAIWLFAVLRAVERLPAARAQQAAALAHG